MRLSFAVLLSLPILVSIHAPREGCDELGGLIKVQELTFQFTHPGRGATLIRQMLLCYSTFQFTHPGRGATYRAHYVIAPRNGFQFTHPGRGATV